MAACFKEGEPRWERAGSGSTLRSKLQSRTEPEKAGLQGWVSMDSSYPQALKRSSSRRSLPTALRHPLRTSDLVT